MNIFRHITAVAAILMAAVAPTASALSPSQQEDAIAAVDYIAEVYPSAHLTDVYKSFFQDAFGPGHVIASRQGAVDAINAELAEMDSAELPEVPMEAVGFRGQYYRVDLGLVKAGLITVDQLVDAMIEGAEPLKPISVERWASDWDEIYQLIRNSGYSFTNERAEARAINDNLANGDPVGHHSDIFVKLYSPHYRIVRSDVFEKKLMPLLKDINFE